MSLFGTILLPAFLILAGALMLHLVQLKLFSRSARDLDRIDIPNEVREIPINQVEMLAGEEADVYFRHAWKITRWERRQATSSRMRHTRKWIYYIIANAVVFQEVARFHIEFPEEQGDEALPRKVMERATSVQIIAVACLAKLAIIDACRVVWPLYIPELADHFQFRGHDLIAWYRQLAKDMLQLAQEEYDDITYTRFIFQLTGLCTLEEAEGLNRL